MNDDRKFFDVSGPDKVGPQPTSKPVIVGHHPMMPDPMLRGDNNKPQPPTPNIPASNTIDLSNMRQSPDNVPALDPLYQEARPNDATGPATVIPTGAFGPEPPPFGVAMESPPAGNEELHVPAGQSTGRHKPRIWVWVLITLIVLAAIYAAVDAKSDVLPVHIFSHAKKKAANTSANNTNNNQQSAAQAVVPANFTQYQLNGTPLVFAYPTAWGVPAVTADPGFSHRGTGQKSDGTHAYIIDFATNKDVQVVVTSAKYLPAARGTLYYDFLQWCVGSNDSKFYKQLLHFTTTGGIDTPSTTTCDQGPLGDATKLTDAVIVQANTKDASGAALGDVYTANLSGSDLVVFRVKDAKMTNGDDIKKLIATIHGTASNSQ